MKTVTLPPYAPTLIESTRAMGYTLEAAIADILDNSISAGASNIDIFFFPVDAHIAILDNGHGMDACKIDSAMRYGSKSPIEKRDTNDLGRFGLGMKTASLSQCRTLTVVSKQGECVEARRWDIDHVAKMGDWSMLILEEHELNDIPYIYNLGELDSGTLILWQNMDRLSAGELDSAQAMGKKMDIVRTHLSLVFHRYLNGETGLRKVKMSINSKAIKATDPFLSDRYTQVMDDEIIEINGALIIVRSYILPHISKLSSSEIVSLGGKDGLRKSQGFYVYRNKRLLVWGTWFRMMRKGELSKLARVQVDIPNELDNLWTIDIKKSTAVPPAIVRNNLGIIIERLAEQSKKTWVYRGKKEIKDDIVHVWNRNKGRVGIFYEINRDHPVVEVFNSASPEVQRNVQALLKAIETSIPLNQLYLDLTSEVQVENMQTYIIKE